MTTFPSCLLCEKTVRDDLHVIFSHMLAEVKRKIGSLPKIFWLIQVILPAPLKNMFIRAYQIRTEKCDHDAYYQRIPQAFCIAKHFCFSQQFLPRLQCTTGISHIGNGQMHGR